jgi:hypothetical protein
MLNSNSFQLKKIIQICICFFSVKQEKQFLIAMTWKRGELDRGG